ncbi:uncharacterized protein BDZ99DRAFT_573678 [Mytilinidion resinicola]|uniref:Uncharacterized protein n=1 Tax=Mytilinidion resinicola TaxID=574789 RepID=A0A6A6YEH2_9PEZI|nr:uncharacterized protein BDZ99DRAFT_573678 [Mytilinidion resinicola]KAF2806999.1 hypothetical protein BDZ99DRAFT_573678 [Mytilinidion resinicola]
MSANNYYQQGQPQYPPQSYGPPQGGYPQQGYPPQGGYPPQQMQYQQGPPQQAPRQKKDRGCLGAWYVKHSSFALNTRPLAPTSAKTAKAKNNTDVIRA